MAKHGVYSYSIMEELKAAAEARSITGIYSGKHTAKAKKIHVAVHDSLGEKHTRLGNKRCTCGGWTFTTIWAGDKVACRHCGKQYFKSEFEVLPEQKLTPAEREDRRIFSMLLAGGDLREDNEKNVLVLKDSMGLPAGELPLEYAQHIASVYKDAEVMVSRKKTETETNRVGISLLPVKAV